MNAKKPLSLGGSTCNKWVLETEPEATRVGLYQGTFDAPQLPQNNLYYEPVFLIKLLAKSQEI